MPRHTTRYNQKCDDRHKFDELIPLEIKALQAFAISNGINIRHTNPVRNKISRGIFLLL